MNGVVIVDTDVVSFLFKGDTRAEAYRQHLQSKTLAISFMTVAELYQWAYVRNWGRINFDKAKISLEQALRLFRETGYRRGESRTLGYLGYAFSDTGDYAAARNCMEQALRITCEIGDRQGEGEALGNLGVILTYLGDYGRAETDLKQAVRILREVGDPEEESYRLCDLGLLFHRLDDNETACEYSQQALSIALGIGSRRSQAYAFHFLGHALTGLDRLDEAADSYRKALELRRELGEPHLAIESLAGLARVSLAQGDLRQTQAHVEEILSHLKNDTLDGTDEPLRIYWTCYQALQANHDSRDRAILSAAHHLLQEQAARIGDEETRRLFLENVPAHRGIVRECTRRGVRSVSSRSL